jgi:hypothetical protein
VSDVSSILIRLIDAAERAVCCRPVQELAELCDLVKEMQSPVGAALSPAPVFLSDALVIIGRDRDQETLWRVVIGALLPMVRNDLLRVMEARRQPLEPDTAYRGGHR